MGKLVNLKIDGKKVVLGGPSEMVLAMVKFVSKMKKGEYVTTEGLAERIGKPAANVQSLITRSKELFEKYRALIQTPTAAKTMVYGSEASIKKLKAELEMN